MARRVCLGVFTAVTGHPFWAVVGVGVLVLVPGYVAGPVFYLGLGLTLAGWREARASDRAERRIIRARLGLADPAAGRPGRHAASRRDADDDPAADRYADAFDRFSDRRAVVEFDRDGLYLRGSVVGGRVAGGSGDRAGAAGPGLVRPARGLVGK